MKNVLNFVAVAALLVILALLIQSVFAVIPLRWEYKVVDFGAESPEGVDRPRVDSGAADFSYVNPAESTLNELGQEGWEMVGCYLETETAWPNFGDAKFVIGLQPNVRPQRLVLIFKRPLRSRGEPAVTPTIPPDAP